MVTRDSDAAVVLSWSIINYTEGVQGYSIPNLYLVSHFGVRSRPYMDKIVVTAWCLVVWRESTQQYH